MDSLTSYLSGRHYDIRSNQSYLSWYASQIKSDILRVRFLSKINEADLVKLLGQNFFIYQDTKIWRANYRDLMFYLSAATDGLVVEMTYFNEHEVFRAAKGVGSSAVDFIEHIIKQIKG